MNRAAWRAPTEHERALVDDWLAAWNSETGDVAVAPQDLRVRGSCDCGTCPTFTAKPLALRPPRNGTFALDVGGHADGGDAGTPAGLVVFRLADDEVEFEVYPYSDRPAKLAELAFEFGSDKF